MNHRLRVAGGAVLQSAAQIDKPLGEALTKEALALLGQATHDWIPGAARISAALPWEGVKLLSPDGLPVIGNVLHPRLFVNAGHGPAGWGLGGIARGPRRHPGGAARGPFPVKGGPAQQRVLANTVRARRLSALP
jgi:glycine/D-amino acid oxidase-like deaminating enzyme